jgi:hypothetical protein
MDPLPPPTGICLAMIVRDEAAIIERCLASVEGLIDSYVIVDTGSSDATVALIHETMGETPGVLVEAAWKDFATNRTQLMELAEATAPDKYLLLLDADNTVEQVAEFDVEDLEADEYMLAHDEGDLTLRLPRLVRAGRGWFFRGVTHEYLDCEQKTVRAPLDALLLHHHADGGTRNEKFERDWQLLIEAVAKDPDDQRAVFYLAQTCRDRAAGDPHYLNEAMHYYLRRAEMGGWDEEVFVALLEAGKLAARLDQWPLAAATLLRAYSARPSRAEPLYELAAGHRGRGEHAAALVFATRGLEIGQPEDDILFVAPWVYDFGIIFEFSIAAYWMGMYDSAYAATEGLLEREDLPETYRTACEANKDFCVEKAREPAVT